MKRLLPVLKWGFSLVVFVGLGTWGYYYIAYPVYTWHQKMTVEVEVNGQEYTGSSVVQVSAQENAPLQFGFPTRIRARGEAVFVVLPANRYLFALLSGGPPDSGPETNALNVFQDRLLERGIERFAVLSQSRFKKDIPPSHYPLLVTFTDINDPKTVKHVDPENLAATFGPGVSLGQITLEITDEPLTEGKIERELGWWCDLRKKRERLNGSTSVAITNNELSNNLGTGSFRIGDCT